MGIKQLMKLLSDNAPGCIRETEMKNYFNRVVAVDASMSLYQFLIAVRNAGPDGGALTNESGEVTSHLQGMFYRTIRMMENGVKPIFVFDGKPPELKGGELEKRKEARDKAREELKAAEEKEDTEAVRKYERRLVHVSKEQNEEVKQLLSLMGVPYINAPCEAEAQCAELVKHDLAFATATEDMDALTFESKKLLRHMTFSAARKMPIVEIDLKIALEDLELTMDQFIHMCILCGCDYTNTIRGIGPAKSFDLIKKYKTIDEAIKHIDKKRHPIPAEFLYQESFELFKNPEVTPAAECKPLVKWNDCDEEGLIAYLAGEKQFNADRVRGGIARLKKAKGKGNQKRLDSFFSVVSTKRKKPPTKAQKAKAKKAKTAKTKSTKAKSNTTPTRTATKPKKKKRRTGLF